MHKKKKILLCAGARPNFMKIAPIIRAMKKHSLEYTVVNTGQHVDNNMSKIFFKSLDIPSENFFIPVEKVIFEIKKVCNIIKPDLAIVVGDVNATLLSAIGIKYLNIPLAHVEAGLRSGDKSMPEETNRIATDSISDIHFVSEFQGVINLIREGHNYKTINFVGNVMVDNLFYQLSKLKNKKGKYKKFLPSKYACLTMHRPSNVDDKEILHHILIVLNKIASKTPIIFPCHPRTQKNITKFNFWNLFSGELTDKVKSGLYAVSPLDYDEFLCLWKEATFVLTDSGGLQEETTALKIPCITLRESTERPVTVTEGSNVLAGIDSTMIQSLCSQALNGRWKQSSIPAFWDGKASERIIEIIK